MTIVSDIDRVDELFTALAEQLAAEGERKAEVSVRAGLSYCPERPLSRRLAVQHHDVMTSKLYDTDMAKERITVYLDPEVAQALRVSAARRKMKDSELVEEALRDKLLFTLLDRISARAGDLTDDEAMGLALRAQREVREERQRREQAAS
ncbi:MAG TPA: CopG family transcriptional regulator [Gaiellaceae bacterium]|nr:CopG family transcriptional regulator [Gaiellaceae bacterium]